MKRTIWTEEAAAVLRDLVGRPLSAGQIARALGEKLGQPVTRSQTVAKIARLGLQLHDARKTPPQERWHKPIVKEIAPAPEPPPRPTETPTPGVAFSELTSINCHYEVTTGFPLTAQMKFCGQPTVPGTPYCEKHRKKMVAPGWRSPEQRAEARQARLAAGRARMRIR